MKYGMAGRSKEFFRKRQQIRSPGPNRDNDRVSTNSMSIFEDNAFNTIVTFIKRGELDALT